MNPTFSGFSLNDANFITERITFKGYANRDVVTNVITRREGVKLLATNFTSKEVTIDGHVLGSSASDLQSKLDTLKQNLVGEEGALILESGRTFTATVSKVDVPDQQYNQSMNPFSVTFLLSNPFSEGAQLTANTPVTSGTLTFSGSVNISGTMFNRPQIVYTPGSPTSGLTGIKSLTLYHVPTGQSLTVSGFNSGSPSGLMYQNAVTFDLDNFLGLDGTTPVNPSGAFMQWQPGVNAFTITSTSRFPGGTMGVIYKPRYL